MLSEAGLATPVPYLLLGATLSQDPQKRSPQGGFPPTAYTPVHELSTAPTSYTKHSRSSHMPHKAPTPHYRPLPCPGLPTPDPSSPSDVQASVLCTRGPSACSPSPTSTTSRPPGPAHPSPPAPIRTGSLPRCSPTRGLRQPKVLPTAHVIIIVWTFTRHHERSGEGLVHLCPRSNLWHPDST